MGNPGAPPPEESEHHKNSSKIRSGKKKVGLKSRERRRRHDSPSSSSSSSSDSECDDGSRARRKKRISRRRRRNEEDVKRAVRKSNRDEETSQQHRKKRRKDEEESKRRDSRSRSNRGKSGREKKPQRGRSVSVSSPGSHSGRSCSTCRSRSSSASEDRKIQKVKSGAYARSRVRDEGRRGRRNSHGGYRSPSCSPGCRHNHSSSRSRSQSQSRSAGNASVPYLEEKRSKEKSSRRHGLSPSTVTKGSKEIEHRYPSSKSRLALIQDFDDFSSLQSNNSCDGGRNIGGVARSLVQQQHVLEERRHADDVGGVRKDGLNHTDETDGKRVEFSSSVAVAQLGGGAQCYGQVDSVTPRDQVVSRVKSEISGYAGSSDADDLEDLLRQKALENFRKFRGELFSSEKSIVDRKDEFMQTESCEVASAKAEPALPHQSDKSVVVSAKKTLNSLEHNPKTTSISNISSLAATTGNHMEKDNGNAVQKCFDDIENSKSGNDSVVLNSGLHSKEAQVIPSELHVVHESSDKKMQEEDSLGNNRRDNKIATKSGSSNMHKDEVNEADGRTSRVSSSCHNPGVGDSSSVETKVDTKATSEFEQKTMSVMRGGEMVQVSYKVYIPKKTPALARRQLQR